MSLISEEQESEFSNSKQNLKSKEKLRFTKVKAARRIRKYLPGSETQADV